MSDGGAGIVEESRRGLSRSVAMIRPTLAEHGSVDASVVRTAHFLAPLTRTLVAAVAPRSLRRFAVGEVSAAGHAHPLTIGHAVDAGTGVAAVEPLRVVLTLVFGERAANHEQDNNDKFHLRKRR